MNDVEFHEAITFFTTLFHSWNLVYLVAFSPSLTFDDLALPRFAVLDRVVSLFHIPLDFARGNPDAGVFPLGWKSSPVSRGRPLGYVKQGRHDTGSES